MEMTEVPTEVFRAAVSTLLKKYVSAPTRRDLGTKLRKLKPVVTTRSVVEEMLSKKVIPTYRMGTTGCAECGTKLISTKGPRGHPP